MKELFLTFPTLLFISSADTFWTFLIHYFPPFLVSSLAKTQHEATLCTVCTVNKWLNKIKWIYCEWNCSVTISPFITEGEKIWHKVLVGAQQRRRRILGGSERVAFIWKMTFPERCYSRWRAMTKTGDEWEAAFWNLLAPQTTGKAERRGPEESELITLLVDKQFLAFPQMKGFAEHTVLFLNTWGLPYQLQARTVGGEKPGFKCLAQGHIKLGFSSWFVLDAEMDEGGSLWSNSESMNQVSWFNLSSVWHQTGCAEYVHAQRKEVTEWCSIGVSSCIFQYCISFCTVLQSTFQWTVVSAGGPTLTHRFHAAQSSDIQTGSCCSREPVWSWRVWSCAEQHKHTTNTTTTHR